MGFLVDLHLFLGRSLVAASTTPPDNREEARALCEDADREQLSVVGGAPPTSLDLVQDRVRDIFQSKVEMDGMRKACDNAYKLYQRTRGSAGNESVARGAELCESMGPSPVLCAALKEGQHAAAGLAEITQAIRKYRPAATVFEAEIANAAKGNGLLAAAARNCSAMQAKRAAHDKHIDKAKETGHGLVARRRKLNRPDADDGGNGGGEDGDEDDEEEHSDGADDDDEFGADDDDDEEVEAVEKETHRGGGGGGKNKRRKKSTSDAEEPADAFNVGKFRDDEFFLDVTPRGVNHTELGLSTMEDALGRPMQDHMSLDASLKQATMDIVEEDGKGIQRQRKVRIWDKKKRNYVQVNADEVDRVRGGKRIKTESGAYAKKDEKAIGEMYKKWTQRTHKSVNATGSQEDPLSSGGGGKGRGLGRFKYRHHKSAEDAQGGGGRGGGGGWGCGCGDDDGG